MVREKIKTALDVKGWSQHAISEKIGIACPNLNAFLNGARPLPYPKLIRLLDELALTIGPKKQGQSIIPPSELPEIFRTSIENSGLMIKEVAEQTGIDLACLSTFLNGSRTTPIRNLEKLMFALDLDVVSLIRPRKAHPA